MMRLKLVEPYSVEDPRAETAAMQAAYDALAPLTLQARLRAVDWLMERIEGEATAAGQGIMR